MLKKKTIGCILTLIILLTIAPSVLGTGAAAPRNNIVYTNSTLNFSVTLPESWKGLYEIDEFTSEYVSGVSFFNANCKKAGYGGFLFGIEFGSDYPDIDKYEEVLLKFNGKAFIITHPGDPQSPGNGQNNTQEQKALQQEYSNMQKSILDIAKSFMYTFPDTGLPFKDVAKSMWYCNDVKFAYETGLINGKTKFTFVPDANLTYSETVKLAACMHQLYTTGSITLANGSPLWYQTYVDYAKTNKIINKDYSWSAMATRAGYMEIFASALPDSALAAVNLIPDGSIPDVPMTHANATAIYKLYRAGIVQGSDAEHNCNPTSNIRRKDVAAILTRMMDASKRIKFEMSNTAANALTWKEIYLKELLAAQAFSADEDSHGPSDYGRYPYYIYGCQLADLNFDGTPELMLFGVGAGASNPLRIFTIDKDGEAIVIFTDSGNMGDIALYRKLSDNSLNYAFMTFIADSDFSQTSVYLSNAKTKLSYDFNEIAFFADYIETEKYDYDAEPNTYLGTTYIFKGNEMSKAEYDRAVAGIFSGYTKLSYSVATLKWEFSGDKIKYFTERQLQAYLDSYVPEK